MASKQTTINLDWTRDPPPSNSTPYQQFIRNVDWRRTELGCMRNWSRELRQMVRLVVAEVHPAILYWGKTNTIIYNEAYVPLVGDKHPQLQGMNASDAFPDFWLYFDHVISEQRLTGETRVGDAQMLLMDRHGFLEETYFDWKLIPIIGDDGTMLGAYGMPAESSKEVINSRRAACIQSLTQQISSVGSYDDLWNGIIRALTQNDKDIPVALLYTIESRRSEEDSSAVSASESKLVASLGISRDNVCLQSYIDVQKSSHGLAHAIYSAINDKSMVTLTSTAAGLGQLSNESQSRGFDVPTENLVVLPIQANQKVAAVLVLGLNPRLNLTSSYKEFIQMIGAVVSPQLSKLLLADEVECHDQIAQSAVSKFRRSELNFSRFAQRSPLGLILSDKSGKVLYANEAWYKFCGLDSTEIGSTSWIETVYDEDLPIIKEWWNNIINYKQGSTCQVRSKERFTNRHMHLPYRTGIVAVYPDLDDNGNVATVMGLVTDISELKWNEEQLRLRQREIEESEAKYRDFAEHAPIGVVRTDPKGYVEFANDTWRSFYNFSKYHEFSEPQPWLASLNKDDVEPASQFFKELSSSGIPKTIEVRLQRRRDRVDDSLTTSAQFWLLATGFAEYNNDGSVSSIVFWVTDISDQKAAERILTNKMEEAIRLKNTQERFVDMISHEIRNPLSAILHCGEEIVDAMKSCLSLSEPREDSGQAPMADIDTQMEVRNRISSALDAANTILYCTQHQKQIVDDVLTLSKLDADLLVVSPIPVQPAEIVKPALKIFEPELKASAIDLVLEPGSSLQKLDVDWIMLDPNRLLQILINLITNAIKFTRHSATRKIVISLDARSDRPPRQYQGVHYVPRRDHTQSTTETIVENGIDRASTTEDLYLCFSVADTGRGLSESECTTLFNRFAQASPKTHIEYGGSGLGLFISRQITEMLGGEIGVGSEQGRGATFAFYVRTRRAKPPRRASLGVEAVSVYTKTLVTPTPGAWVTGHTGQQDSADKKPDHRSVLPTPEPVSHRRRVLVVEDNLVNQKVLCKQLRNRGFQVEAANHGREALDALDKINHDDDPPTHFDVILCDIEMPVMDGIECVTEVRRLENEGRYRGHIPIIGVTANVRSKQVNAAIEAGMDGVTTKPYRIDELIAHIDRVSADVKTSKKTSG